MEDLKQVRVCGALLETLNLFHTMPYFRPALMISDMQELLLFTQIFEKGFEFPMFSKTHFSRD